MIRQFKLCRRSFSHLFVWSRNSSEMGASISTTSTTSITASDENVSKMHDAAAYINSVVNQNCVVIFSKTDCPYSNKAKRIFDNLGVGYESIELNQRDDCRVLQTALLDISGEKTVPRVFVNGNCIGGGVDTEKLYQEGKLMFLLDQCGNVIGSSENVNTKRPSETSTGGAGPSDPK